jgi:diguanylate cyclase (GGDEF)-like protein
VVIGQYRWVTPGEDAPVPQLALHLRPVRSFDDACRMVVEYMSEVAPMGLWAVTRVNDGTQLVLTSVGTAYPVRPGDSVRFDESLCSRMVTGEGPRIAPDAANTPAYCDVAESVMPIGAYAGTPIAAPDGGLFGTVCGFDPQPQPESAMVHQPLLDLLSSLLSAVLDGDLRATAAARELEQARRDADLDVLTGLLNRRGWDRYLQAEEERFRRFGDQACVVVIDLDRLKVVNDTQGHEAGDRYIQRAAQVLAGTVRDGDVLARLGGDEFGIVAVGATPEQAREMVVRADRAMRLSGVTGSFGFAPYSVVSGFPGAWEAADQAMYEQKRRRRARVGA